MKKVTLKELVLYLTLAVLVYGPFVFIAIDHGKNDFLSLLGIVFVVTVVYGFALYQVGNIMLNKNRNKNG